MVNKATTYDDEAICQDLAKADLSIAAIAVKHKISASQCYKIVSGDARPELKERIEELIKAEKGAGIRLARHRARWTIGRLIQIGGQDEDRGAALKALERLAEMAGMLTESGVAEKKAIEIIFSSKGSGEDDPLKHRLTGVVNGNN